MHSTQRPVTARPDRESPPRLGAESHSDVTRLHLEARREPRGELPIAHYGEFVQWERWKANGQFGAKRTVVSVMPNGVVQRSRVEAMTLSMMK